MSNVHNNQEKAPDVEQQHSAPSLLSAMKLSDGPDRSVSESKIGVLDLASVSPRPWERDSKGPQFMHSQRVAASNFVGAFNDWIVSASPGVLLFTLPSEVIMFNTERKTIRRLSYGFRVKSTSAAHNLSPDGNTLVRWILNETNQTSTLMAIDVSSKKQIAELQRSHRFQQSDILNAIWIDDSTIYIPISAEGIIIPWNIRGATPQTKDLEVIEPLPSIACHSILKFEITKNRSWWTATGITFDPPSGFIEVHDVEHDESRVVDGMVSCVTEVEVNGKEKALLASAGVTQDFKVGESL
ncbi:hypothetical protein FRC02_001114 [Tulasnella sp. 418]|nr:hypothetical protein FRC02_001114 [Tulasnella sp. 418]